MRKLKYYILTIFISLSCSEKNPEWKAEREASIHFGGEPKNENFVLSFHRKGDTLIYNYVGKIDSTKTINIQKVENSNILFFGFGKFIESNRKSFRNQKLKDLEFKYYHLENPGTHGTGPILFNSEYGLLAINNVYGPTIVFLEVKDNNLTEMIINNLNE
ncbi:hypothetical protein [Gelidibacter japonicus]|uniref:hypothetical protein n=1 Tax=Gelidibacter japonicus TaxID=1962232 RepID=UPI002021EC5C|nr:hypothetical protein [Gelidibacter japonicus]MCL8009565.1 hypothetical protein [Gelidibacter japonicus]